MSKLTNLFSNCISFKFEKPKRSIGHMKATNGFSVKFKPFCSMNIYFTDTKTEINRCELVLILKVSLRVGSLESRQNKKKAAARVGGWGVGAPPLLFFTH